MKCENCGMNEATIHYSENINGKTRELNLCEECSHKLGINKKMDFNMPIDFSSFFAGMLEDFESPDLLPMLNSVRELQCKSCGYTFDDILNTGKFGCANCYDTFEDRLDSIIRKIQGSNQHVGRLGGATEHSINSKSIPRAKKVESKKDKVDVLKDDLKKAIKEERYEDAAKLRDEIAEIEKKNEKEE